MACYDTKKGSLVFKKMHESNVAENQMSALGRDDNLLHKFLSTHPPSEERFKYLSEASTHENASKYENKSDCNRWTELWRKIVYKSE